MMLHDIILMYRYSANINRDVLRKRVNMALSRWILTEEEQNRYISALVDELAPLRAKAGISQGELCNLIGISRQTYSALEGRRRPMTWSNYLSLILFFDNNVDTRDMLRNLPAYPKELFFRMNEGKLPDQTLLGQSAGELNDILKELDDQARHALKTMLLVEYARCKKIPGDIVIKAFDGINLTGTTADAATEQALRNIRSRKG